MKYVKSIVLCLLIVLLVFVFAACGNEKAEKYCYSCGEGISGDAAFCEYCGAFVSDKNTETPSSASGNSASTTEKKPASLSRTTTVSAKTNPSKAATITTVNEPITQNASKQNEVTNKTTKAQKVTSLGKYSVTTHNNSGYALTFELNDQNGKTMPISGWVDIRIVDQSGISVYEGRKYYSESDFRNDANRYQVTVIINYSDINTALSSSGILYFSVCGTDFFIDEKSAAINNMPSINVQVPEAPVNINTFEFNINVGDYTIGKTIKINSFSFKVDQFDHLYIYCSGEKTYDEDGTESTHLCWINWKLYDSDGNLIDRGVDTISGLKVGDKFKNEQINISTNIHVGESYRLEISDYK